MLKECDLSKIKAERCDFGGCHLSLCNLSGADLTEADLRFAVLIGANLKGAKLIYSDFTCADLRHAQLIGANFWGTRLRKAQMESNNRLAALPFQILGLIVLPVQKRFREAKLRKENLHKKRAEELLQTVRPRK
jgi:uncharacterized protein YjbI with pentapeptide repeats